MQIRIDVAFPCPSEEAASSISALEMIQLRAYAQRSWRAGKLSPEDGGIILGMYTGLYDWKKVRRRDGEAGEGCANR